jgi:parallel beta-helix repeat protein
MGFVVEKAGIQLTNAVACRLHLNEIRNIADLTLWLGNTRYGIRLISSSFNEVTQNFVHDCVEGILLSNGSSGNTVRGNHTFALGLGPVVFPIAPFSCGLQVGGAPIGGIPGGNNNNNLIAENEFVQTYWGIQLTSAPANTGNLLSQNRCHENQRAGIGINGPSNGNLILQNNCTGNGLGNLPPSGTFDLFDAPPDFNNIWERNQGTSNF